MSLFYVNVKFKNSTRTYAYLYEGDAVDLQGMTNAVVASPSDGLTVVEIVNHAPLDYSTYDGEYKYLVTVFNLDGYNERVNREVRKRTLEKELRRRVASRKLSENFEKLLEGDEEAKKLIEEYKSL